MSSKSLLAISASRIIFTQRSRVRQIFYITYYAINIILSHDLLPALMTIPMFLTVLWTLGKTPSEQIGQIDILALVFFIFFCVVPLQQVDEGMFVYGELVRNFRYPLSDFAVVHSLAIVFYLCLYTGVASSSAGEARVFMPRGAARPILIVVIIAAILANIQVQDGIENVLAPRYLKEDNVSGQIAPVFLGLQSVATFIYLLLARRENNPGDIPVLVLLLALLAFVANPFNVARFALIGVWTPILLLLLPILLRPAIFYAVSLFLLTIAVPLLSISSRMGLVDRQQAYEGLTAGSVFTLKNLNVLELSLEALAYTRKSGFLSGDIFISTVLTYVPRAWWPAKPLASNLEIGRNLVSFYHYSNDNLAVPWFMDGYMDFGVAGAVAYSVLAGFVLRWLNLHVRGYMKGVDLYGLIFLANFLILARGTVAVVCSLFLFQILALLIFRYGLMAEIKKN